LEAVTPDASKAVLVDGHQMMVWNLETGTILHSITVPAAQYRCEAVTPDGKKAVFSDRDHHLFVLDLETNKQPALLTGHASRIVTVIASPDSRNIYSLGEDGKILIWDLVRLIDLPGQHDFQQDEGNLTALLDGREAIFDSGEVISPRREISIPVSDEGTITILDPRNNKERYRVTPLENKGTDSTLVVKMFYNQLEIWDRLSDRKLAGYHADHQLLSCIIIPERNLIVAQDKLGNYHFLHLEGWRLGKLEELARPLPISEEPGGRLQHEESPGTQAAGVELGQLSAGETSPVTGQPSADVLAKEGERFLELNPAEALRCFNQALLAKPDNFNLLFSRSTALIRMGENQAGIRALDDILQRDLASGGTLGYIYINKGTAQFNLGDQAGALETFQKGLAFVRDNPDIWFLHGTILYNLNRFAEAIESFHQARMLRPDQKTRIFIGFCYMNLGKIPDAEKVYKDLVADGMADATVYFSLATIVNALGKKTEARAYLEKFLKVATPEHQSVMPRAQKMLEELSK